MDYNEVLQRARARMAPRCKVCPECNGLGCGNTMPGPGSKAPGNGANDNWRAWRRWCLNMDTIAPNTPVDTSLELLGRTFSLPVIAAPIGSLRAQFHPEDDIRDYNACCIAAAAQTGIAASFGDGLDARVFPHGCALSQQYGGIGLPVEGHLWSADKNWGYIEFKTREDVTDRYVTYAEKLMELVERGFSAAVYTQTTDVEGEVNGLVTYDREVVKVDVDRLHEVNRRLVRSLDL